MHADKDTRVASHQAQQVILLATISVLLVVAPFVANGILVLLSALASEFGADPTSILLAVSAFMVPFAIVELFSGAISDVKGRTPVITGGLVGYSVGMALAAASPSLPVFVLAHAIMGASWGFVNPVVIALVSDLSPPDRISSRMGIVAALGSIGVAVAPFLAGYLVAYGWRFFYAILAVISILTAVVMASRRRVSSQSAAGGQLGLFIRILVEEARRPVVILLTLSGLMLAATYLAMTVWISRVFAGVVPETTTGFLLMESGLVAVVTGILAGMLIRRHGAGVTLSVGLISLVLSTGTLLFFYGRADSPNMTAVTLALLLVGCAGGMLYPAQMYCSQMFSPERRGAIAGLLTSVQFAGLAAVPVVYEPFFLMSEASLFAALFAASMLYVVVAAVLWSRARDVLRACESGAKNQAHFS